MAGGTERKMWKKGKRERERQGEDGKRDASIGEGNCDARYAGKRNARTVSRPLMGIFESSALCRAEFAYPRNSMIPPVARLAALPPFLAFPHNGRLI